MTIDQLSASAQDVTWEVRPVDETGALVNPSPLVIEWTAVPVDTALTDVVTWADLVAVASGSDQGEWAGPDSDGYYTARVLVSGTGGTGQIRLTKGTYDMYLRIIDSPEQPARRIRTLRII